MSYGYHRYSEYFPSLSADEFAKLREDIRQHGQLDPIVLYDGVILDGRHRYRACLELGISPKFKQSKASNDHEALCESSSRNLSRRHMTASQQAMVCAKMLPEFEAEAKKRQGERTDIRANLRGCSKATGSKASEEVAELGNISARSVESAKRVIDNGVADLAAAVINGYIKVSRAEEVSKLEPDLQLEVVARVKGGERASDVVREIKTGTIEALHSSNSNEWYTPSEYVEAARRVMGSIDLDPASCDQANETVNASTYYTKEDDGLSKPWFGNVWCNPPYGKEGGESNQGRWTSRILGAYKSGEVDQATILVNAVTDRAWFQPFWEHAICFVSRRIKFYSPDSKSANPTHGSAIIYLGDNIAGFKEAFRAYGQIVIGEGDDPGVSTAKRV